MYTILYKPLKESPWSTITLDLTEDNIMTQCRSSIGRKITTISDGRFSIKASHIMLQNGTIFDIENQKED